MVKEMTNLWKELPPGPDPPKKIYTLVEVPKECSNKYEFDCKTGVLRLDRVLYSALYYPGDYGIIPQTWSLDNDPLDILVLTTRPTFPGCIMTARPIGALTTEDEGGEDDKILGVPLGDPRFEEVTDVKDIANHLKAEISDFFLSYKRLEPKKWVKVKSWKDAQAAEGIVASAIKLYRDTFPRDLKLL
jgi:inorganic pyrophosphatase